jgi:hypothetical protein
MTPEELERRGRAWGKAALRAYARRHPGKAIRPEVAYRWAERHFPMPPDLAAALDRKIETDYLRDLRATIDAGRGEAGPEPGDN